MLLYMAAENRLPASFVDTPLASFTLIISSNVSLFTMTSVIVENYQVKLPVSEDNQLKSIP